MGTAFCTLCPEKGEEMGKGLEHRPCGERLGVLAWRKGWGETLPLYKSLKRGWSHIGTGLFTHVMCDRRMRSQAVPGEV